MQIIFSGGVGVEMLMLNNAFTIDGINSVTSVSGLAETMLNLQNMSVAVIAL